MTHKTPTLAIDSVIVYRGKIVLIKRKYPPFQDMFAIPGGHVEIGETVEDAVHREAKEETGLDVKIIRLIGIYSEPSRDPRGHVVSICFLTVGSGTLKADSDAKEVSLFDVDKLPSELAFDHKKILEDGNHAIRYYLPYMSSVNRLFESLEEEK